MILILRNMLILFLLNYFKSVFLQTTARPRQAKRPAPPPTIEDQPRQKMVAIEPGKDEWMA